jgi:hypothetical protein
MAIADTRWRAEIALGGEILGKGSSVCIGVRRALLMETRNVLAVVSSERGSLETHHHVEEKFWCPCGPKIGSGV